MKRNRKYNKNLVQENIMNGLRHIVLLLGIGLFFAQESPEEFQFNQSTLQAFYYINSVTINGSTVESADWVGAFNGDVCVGARQWDTSLCGEGAVCELPAMGNDGGLGTEGYLQSGEFPSFKIYDTSENMYYDAIPSENFAWASQGLYSMDNLIGGGFGCMDMDACNYDADATADDGSCEYAEENYDCDGNCVVEVDCTGECGGSAVLSGCDNVCGSTLEDDACGVCGGDNSSCAGCTDLYAFNYDLDALVNDGSCEYPVYGCTDETALNYNSEATNSNGNCDYPPEVGIWFGNIDANAGTMEIYSSSDSDLDNISFSISDATITGATEGSVTNNNFTLSGSMNPGSGPLTVLSFTDGGSEYCLSDGFATAPGYDSVNITLGGCSVLVGLEGGVVESETGGVDIPEGALSESENIAVGDVTEELPEEVDNATGFEVEELVAFTPFDLVFEVPVEISVSSTSQSRDGEYLCYLEDANDTEWAVVDGANCTDGTCIADVMEFGIFATCVLVEDCKDDLGGFAYLDDCGECVGGNTGNVANYTMDDCGLCDGPGYIEWYEDTDGDNLGYGDGAPFCSDVVPDGYVPNNEDIEPNCGSNDTDECDVCGGDGSSCADSCADGGCDCEGTPGGDAVEDCDGVCGGDAVEDNCGTCDNDSENDCECDYVDSCGVCNGDNSDCWFIDISSRAGNLGIEDNSSRIGMHEAAEDIFNVEDHPEYDCNNGETDCYKDVLDNAMNPPGNWIDFYFPHPEWEEDIQEYMGQYAEPDLRQDIRHLETFTLPDLDNNSTIFVNETIYYIQQAWDIMIETNPNVSDLPGGNNFVALDFNFTNQIPNSGGFTKVFFYKEVSGIGEIEEITTFGGSSDPTCLSDYCIKLDDYNLLSDLRIILGTDTVIPSATIVSPLPNEIFALEDDNFLIELDLDNPEMIAGIKLFFEVDGEISNAISVDVAQFIEVENNEYYEFLNEQITGNFAQNVNIYIEITDVAGSTANDYPSGEYRSDLGPLTFSRNSINLEIGTGWNLLAPPVQQQEELDNIFAEDAYGCTLEGCPKISTASSGTGFYTRSYGENSSFTFNGEVLSEFSTNLEPGWNLIGNPLVTSVDINTVIINHNGLEYKWPEASKYGIISPTPIIYDNESGGHIGTELLSSGAGFWLYSYHGDVEISFIPSTTAEEIEASNYWNLSLFAIENNAGAYSDDRIGSEIVIGIREDANNAFVDGEDQEIFPLSEMNIFNSYSDLSINNDGQTSLYRDIRSFHETSITWDLEGESVPSNSGEAIQFTWEFSGNNDPYNYYLDVGEDSPVNMKDFSSQVVSHNYFLEDLSITAELKAEYIGCTDPDALNYNLLPNGANCTGGTCLGGNRAEFCENYSSVSLVLPETYTIDQEVPEFELPISLDNPEAIAIEGLQFILEYDAEMVQVNDVTLNENLNEYLIEQGLCTDCIPAELSVNIYFVGLKEDFTDANENYIWDEGEPFEDINGNGIYDDESFNGEGEILTLSGYGLPNTGTTTITFSSVQINESENAFGNSCEISMGLVSLSVSGGIIYYKNGLPVSDGFISITQIDNLSNINSDMSNEDGTFIIESLIDDKTYELLLEKDEYGGNLDDYFDGLSAVDASRIARHAGNLYNFSTKEKIAANVNFDYRCEDGYGNPIGDNESESECEFNWVPNIEAGDAVLVAKYAAGINAHLNQDEDGNEQCDPHWVFINPGMELMLDYEACVDIPYEINLESSISDLVFEGIRLGDVTGNWTAPLGRQNDNNVVENPTIEVEVGQIIKLPIYLPNKVEIEGVDLTIQFDPEVFTLIGFNDNNSILEKSKYPTIINTEKLGLFTLVSYANSTPINDNGLLGNIKFEVIGNSSRWSSISINKMKINDIQEGGFLVEDQFESSSIAYGFDFHISAVPEVFALNKNYPNPFNPNTNIQFELPIDGDIKIFIYDLKGSLVDELMNGYMEAGYHQIKWDGSRQASGIYFVRMIADNGNYIKMTKMMLVK